MHTISSMEVRPVPRWVSLHLRDGEPRAFVYVMYSRHSPEMRYIGRTGNIEERARQHETGVRDASEGDVTVKAAYAFLANHGIGACVLEVLCEVPDEEAASKEAEMIEVFRTVQPFGLNMRAERGPAGAPALKRQKVGGGAAAPMAAIDLQKKQFVQFLQDKNWWNAEPKFNNVYDKRAKKAICDSYKTWRNEHRVEAKGTKLENAQLVEYFFSTEFGAHEMEDSEMRWGIGDHYQLLHCARKNDYIGVQRLVESGMDLSDNIIDEISVVLSNTSCNILKKLMEIEVNANSDTADDTLTHLTSRGDLKRIRIFIDHKVALTVNHVFNSKDLVTAQTLIGAGATVRGENIPSSFSHPGHHNVVRFFVEHGAKGTGLGLSRAEDGEMAKILIGAGADVNCILQDYPTKHPWSVLYMASKLGKLDVVEAIHRAGGTFRCIEEQKDVLRRWSHSEKMITFFTSIQMDKKPSV
jgi:hypothetical protein